MKGIVGSSMLVPDLRRGWRIGCSLLVIFGCVSAWVQGTINIVNRKKEET